MFKQYSLLKGTISQLQIFDDPKESQSYYSSLIDEIASNIVMVILFLILILFPFLMMFSLGSITLKGKRFCCFVGRKFVEGKLTHISFKNGDYVEMVVDKSDDNYYQSYAVRIPKTHALYFPHSVDMPTLYQLKNSAKVVGVLCLLIYMICMFMFYFNSSLDSDLFLFFTFSIFYMFLSFTILFFFLLGGRYSFIGNRIFATLGYPKPWSHNTSAEHERFKKLNRSGDPELYGDPQTPEFERIKIRDAKATYYCRTPIVPDWVEVIDERGFTPDLDDQKSHFNQI